MATNLQTPILNNRIRSVNFFNGRLLTGEDLTSEQQANRAAHNLLGRALGSGVVDGMGVAASIPLTSVQAPVLHITKGLAINRRGAALLLANDADVALLRPASAAATPSGSIFQDCTPVQSGAYIAGAGVYLLTVGPATAGTGLAEVSGVSTAAASCNTNYNADGVQFRLVQAPVDPAVLANTSYLQNALAYLCFGLANWDNLRGDLFGVQTSFGLIDPMRQSGQLTDCEVPLALLYWTADSGVVFVDQWSVRRRITRSSESAAWPLSVNDRPDSLAEAAFLQFQDQLATLFATVSAPSLVATSVFRYLPAAGILPVTTGPLRPQGFDPLAFFSGLTTTGPVFINGARLEMVLRDSLRYRPIDLTSGELIRLYLVRENRQPPAGASTNPAQPYLVFSTGHAPNYGDAHFNVGRWDYSNYF